MHTASETLLKEEKLTSLRMQGLQNGQNGRNICWSRLLRNQRCHL
ncbi:hypothetical protein ANACAC_00353 [Anaerostipes caccae L1-92]|uniref:Uncharacterized protein n=1 Tax=Anaerostipes caccae (strain DSM 14662 / CCUG 47493 / JCM 13470 / NCIMB 13811 / L1-92) TaxID=411490 RepID=B0M9Y0_ANACD|nr:hypothetical protein ANACAC_00353 [Anaerostipes caccae L1-92]